MKSLIELLQDAFPYIKELQKENYTESNVGIFEDVKLTELYNNIQEAIAEPDNTEKIHQDDDRDLLERNDQ